MSILSTPMTLTTNTSLLHSQSQQTKTQTVVFSRRTRTVTITACSASENPQQQSENKTKTNKRISDEEMGINPVGFLLKRGITHKLFAQFLRERYKALKDLKDEIFNRHINLKDMSTGYELLGMHRHPEHRADYMEWAPGARYCALIGDFNGWSPTENCAREGRFGHDDYGYWFIILQDKLREGEKPDELYFQRYNYVDDYDKGDSGVTIEELFKKSNDEYWNQNDEKL